MNFTTVFSLILGSVKLDQIFRGAPHSPVSLLNKSSISSTGLTPKLSENLSYTTFTIDKDNSLTLTPVPKPPASHGHSYYEEPKFHKVEFTPRSTPGLDGTSALSHRSESAVEERPREANKPPPLAEPRETEKPRFPLQIPGDGKPKCGSYGVFVPKARRTYEEHVPDVTAYTEPNRADSRCSLMSPSSFVGARPAREEQSRAIYEKSLPVKTLIDTFEHNNRPVMRYLQLEERVPLSPEIRHLHDDPPPVSYRNEPKPSEKNGFYTCDTTVETRSFAYAAEEKIEAAADLFHRPVDEKTRFPDIESGLAESKSGVADNDTGYANAKPEFVDGNNGFSNGKSGFVDSESGIEDDKNGSVVDNLEFANRKAEFVDAGSTDSKSRIVDGKPEFVDGRSGFADDKSVFADSKSGLTDEYSGYTDRSEYGDRSDDVCPFQLDTAGKVDARFQTVRQLATPDSLESSMLFAQKQTSSEARRQELQHNVFQYDNGAAQVKARGKGRASTGFCTFERPSQNPTENPFRFTHAVV